MVDIATGRVELVAVLDRSYLVMQDAFLFILGPGGATAKGVSAKLGEFLGNFCLNGPIFPSLLPYGRNVKLGRFGQNWR